jgi:diguanylate cyclase (GGDEF)-like protein
MLTRGTVLNTDSGVHLQDLFLSEKWKGHFTTLSDTLAFNLSIYSESGSELFSTEHYYPLCRGLLHSPEFRSRCNAYCHGTISRALRKGKPIIFKCRGRIMSFALPVEYLGEKAVILGQGSFSTGKDFHAFRNLLRSTGIEEFRVTAPLRFTSARQAWSACSLVDKATNQLLKNAQETATLRQKIDGLKDVMGRWGGAARGGANALYEFMIANLSALLDVQQVTIFSMDRQQGVYTVLFGLRKDSRPLESFSISDRHSVVQELIKGKPFVPCEDLAPADRAGIPGGMKSFYFFPIVIKEKLAGILGIFEGPLKESDIHIVQAFCKQTALAIENQQLHQDLYRKFDRFAAISELAKAITSIQNYETLLRTILDKSAELLMAEQGSLMLLDQETDALLLEAKKGIVEGVGEKFKIQRGVGIAGKVAELGEAFLVENLEDDPRVRQKNRDHYKTRSFISVPLKIDGRIIGVLNLSDKTTGEVFDKEDLELIQSFATHAAVILERSALYSQTEKLKKLSITDPLTGLLNRRYLQERLEEEVSRSRRHGRQVSLLMLDLDGFKYYNDTFGHRVGDKTLKIIAEAIVQSVRTIDIVARYGGDEFMVILPETDKALAVNIAERLRNDVAKTLLPTRNTTGLPSSFITASLGIACYPDHGETTELLIDRVDKALYAAKNRGRNRIEVFS